MAYEKGVYQVWDPLEGDEEDGREFTCLDHEYAAEAFAEHQCSQDSDYYANYTDGVDLMVRLKEADAPALPVYVSVEMVPEFHATMQRVLLKTEEPAK